MNDQTPDNTQPGGGTAVLEPAPTQTPDVNSTLPSNLPTPGSFQPPAELTPTPLAQPTETPSPVQEPSTTPAYAAPTQPPINLDTPGAGMSMGTEAPTPFIPPTSPATGIGMSLMPEASSSAVSGAAAPFISPETSHIDTMAPTPSAVSAQPTVTPVAAPAAEPIASTSATGSTAPESNSNGGVLGWARQHHLWPKKGS